MTKLVPFPSYSQWSIGFDRMFQELDRLTHIAGNTGGGYPPFNIERLTDTSHRIIMAVAGFNEAEVNITLSDNVLTIEGEKTNEVDADNLVYRGIAKRNFRREFVLAEHVEVKSATLKDGMLTVELEQQVPEEKRPKKIPLIKE